MRKIELIAAISDETCLPRSEVEVTLETFFKIVKESIINGGTPLPNKHSHITLNFSSGYYKILHSKANRTISV